MTESTTCPCDGSGTYTAEISLAGALVLQDLLCPVHNPEPPRPRLVVRDPDHGGRVGELIDWRSTVDEHGVPKRLMQLRQRGGGTKWVADPDRVEVLDAGEVTV